MTFEELLKNKIDECISLEDLVLLLENILVNHSIDENGHFNSYRALVGYAKNLRIEIYSNEHPPPHFHIKANGVNAVYAINDCSLLKGEISSREDKIVKWWYSNSKKKLVNFWNKTRPTDCQVGPAEL